MFDPLWDKATNTSSLRMFTKILLSLLKDNEVMINEAETVEIQELVNNQFDLLISEREIQQPY